MKLSAQNKLPLDEPVKDFIPQFTGGGKEFVTIRHLLTHSAGLKPFDEYPLGTSTDEIISDIIEQPLIHAPGTVYEYSDFGPILAGKICEMVSGQSFDVLASSLIFKPLGMKTTFYNPPIEKIKRIIPTEYSSLYGETIIGYVHDENAKSIGRIAGQAGLFSTASDLSIFSQMMLNAVSYTHLTLPTILLV